MVSLLVRAATSFYGAACYSCARNVSQECRAVTLGVFLFFSFVFFILCVTSFFRVSLKIKKEKVKIITHTYYEHFFARTLQSSIIAREEKDATKGVKVERYRRVVSLCFFTSERQIFIVGASV